MNIKGYLDKARHGSRYRFGGSKSQATTTTTQAVDNRSIVTNTNTLDGGAIAGALGFASQVAGGAFGAVGQATNSAFKLVGNTADSAFNLADSVASHASANEVHAYDYADSIFHSSLDAINKNDGRAFDAFDRAATISKDSMNYVRGAYDNASHIQSDAVDKIQSSFGASSRVQSMALDQIQNAYADSKGTTQSQQKIMLAVLAVAGVAVVASIKAKG